MEDTLNLESLLYGARGGVATAVSPYTSLAFVGSYPPIFPFGPMKATLSEA